MSEPATPRTDLGEKTRLSIPPSLITSLSLPVDTHSSTPEPDKDTPSRDAPPPLIVTADEEKLPVTLDSMPDGGSQGWMTVCGSWLIMFSTFGYIYSFGVYEDYYTRTFLLGRSPSMIAWMGSFQLALPFALGPLAGRIFDAGHVRVMMAMGSLVFVFSLFMLSLAKQGQYYQVFLSQGVGMGIGSGLLFTPSTAVVGVHFRKRRSLAYGITLSGISIGAVIFPILLNRLFVPIGFGNTVRLTGYIALGCLLVGVALIQPPPRPSVHSQSTNILSFFRDQPYLWFLLSTVFAVLGLFFPAVYLQLYSVKHNIGSTLAFYSIAIINGTGIIGRIGATWLADRYGVWNIQFPSTLGTAVTIWAVLGVRDAASLILVSCCYGILSGAWLSLTISGLVSLTSSPHEVGARVGIANAFMSVGLIVSTPAQGALLTSDFLWVRPIVYSAVLVTVSALFSFMVRTLVARRKGTQWV